MAQVTYNPPADDSEVVSMRGVRFFDGIAVEVTDPAFLRKLSGNKHFTVEGYEPPAEKPVAPQAYAARHVGRGTYAVFFGDEDQRIVSGLAKDAADEFNALSDEDKALRVEEMQADA